MEIEASLVHKTVTNASGKICGEYAIIKHH
jgi:hypothetical protein